MREVFKMIISAIVLQVVLFLVCMLYATLTVNYLADFDIDAPFMSTAGLLWVGANVVSFGVYFDRTMREINND